MSAPTHPYGVANPYGGALMTQVMLGNTAAQATFDAICAARPLWEHAERLIADPESLFYGATNPAAVVTWLKGAINSLGHA